MKSTTCIIVDRDREYRKRLKSQLEYCLPDIIITAEAGNISDAIGIIRNLKPNIVLLDMEMLPPDADNEFENYADKSYALIAIAYNKAYAYRAIKANAVDYVLKPAGNEELKIAIRKAINILNFAGGLKAPLLPNLSEEKPHVASDGKLPVRIGSFYELVSTEEIVFCRANNNYTEVMMNDKRKFLLSKTLKFFEDRFRNQNFCRIHQSFLVNTRFIKSVEKGRYSQLVLKDGTALDIAQARKEKVFSLLGV